MVSCILLVLAVFTSPAFAQWDRLTDYEKYEGRGYGNQDTYEPEPWSPTRTGKHDPLVQPYLDGDIEPGHIPYNCGHITSPRAKRDCQRDWEASDPNDYLNYGR